MTLLPDQESRNKEIKTSYGLYSQVLLISKVLCSTKCSEKCVYMLAVFFLNFFILWSCRLLYILCWFAGFGELLLLLYLITLCSHLVITLITSIISEEQLKICHLIYNFKYQCLDESPYCREIFILEGWRYRKWLCEGRILIYLHITSSIIVHLFYFLSINITPLSLKQMIFIWSANLQYNRIEFGIWGILRVQYSCGLCLAWNECSVSIEEVLLGLPIWKEGKVLWHTSFFAILWDIWLKRGNGIFREVER